MNVVDQKEELLEEIADLKKQNSLQLYITSITAFLMIGTLASVLIEVLVEHISFGQALKKFNWYSLIAKAIYWPLIIYFIHGRQLRKKIKEKEAKLLQLS